MDGVWLERLILLGLALSGLAALGALFLPAHPSRSGDVRHAQLSDYWKRDSRLLSLTLLSLFFSLNLIYLLHLGDQSAVMDVGRGMQKVTFAFWALTAFLAYWHRQKQSVLTWETYAGCGLLLYLTQYVIAFRLLSIGSQSYSASKAIPLFLFIIAGTVVVLAFLWRKARNSQS